MEDINNVIQRKKNTYYYGKECNEKDCSIPIKSRGYCAKHYTQHYRSGDFSESIKENKIIKTCIVDGCSKKGVTRGYCSTHQSRVFRYGDSSFVSIDLHGHSKEGEYSVWSNMKTRCYNKKDHAYKNYGGRGIILCERWCNNFNNFYEDMGLRPSDKHQIDRIDNDGNYEPSNCRWVTQTENARNKRSTKMTIETVKQLRKDRKEGVSYSKLGLKYGISKRNAIDICKNRTWRM